MRIKSLIVLLLALLTSLSLKAQSIIDSCFTSGVVSTSFTSGTNIYNSATGESDLMSWDGTNWNGDWSNANLTLPPPINQANCRAVFIGSGTGWTSGGESFELQLTSGFVAGQTYSFDFTYVSHGMASTGAFTPLVYTNTTPSMGGAFQMANLPPVGNAWTTNTYTFTATAGQAGHDVLIIHSGNSSASGSGMINSFCESCNTIVPCTVDLGPDVVLCQGESVVLDATIPGAIYDWQDGSTNATFTASLSGNYIVTIDEGGCIFSDTVVVTVNPLPIVDLGNDTSQCLGSTLTLDAFTTGAIYTWNTGAPTSSIDVSTPDTYWVDVEVNGCVGSDTILVDFITGPVLDLGPDITLCDNSTAVLDASTVAGNYLWQDGSTNSTFTVTTAGQYFVEVNSGTCQSSDTVDVFYNSAPIVDLGNDTTLCQNDILQLDVTTLGATYLWQDVSLNSTFNVSQAGVYWVEVTANGCTGSDTLVIDYNTIDLGTDILLCPGDAILLDASSQATGPFTWQDGSIGNTFLAAGPGQYWVQSSGGCVASDTVNIDIVDLTLTMALDDSVQCGTPFEVNFTGNAQTNSAGILNWIWDFGDNSTIEMQNPTHVYNSSGVFSVTLSVITVEGCIATISEDNWITVLGVPTANFTFQPSKPTVFEPEVNFTNTSVGAVSWFWDFGDSTTSTSLHPTHEFPDVSGQYDVTLYVTNEIGCIDSITISIGVEEVIIYYVPNTFTPNGDEHNNMLLPVITAGIDVYDYSFTIYNRWGEVVFQTFDSKVGWDGTFAGKLVPTGTYTWVMDFQELASDKRYEQVGHVNLFY